MEYDNTILLAKNSQGEVISACRWGEVWYFVYESKLDGGRIGDNYHSLTELLSNSKNYILNECGYDFKESDLTEKCNKVQLTKEQRTAINTAIMLLENSNSDHAEQCLFYLKTI